MKTSYCNRNYNAYLNTRARKFENSAKLDRARLVSNCLIPASSYADDTSLHSETVIIHFNENARCILQSFALHEPRISVAEVPSPYNIQSWFLRTAKRDVYYYYSRAPPSTQISLQSFVLCGSGFS